ncbi:nephrin-like protein, partial [Euroglyphus maynei]
KPKLTISFGAAIQHDNIHERSNVSIECHVSSNPIVSEIGWIFEGRRLNTKSSIHREWNDSWIEFKANTLLIYNIDRKHAGRYCCMAANVQGEGYNKPVCARGQRSLFGVAQREPLQVPCTVESDPEEVTFRWMFNSSQSESMMMIPIDTFQVLPASKSSLLLPSRTSIARYEPKTRYGYGQLLCWATNKLGEQYEPCRFDIIPAGQPQPLQNCMVRNQSSDGIAVRCQPGDDGGLDQQFHLEIFLADRGQMVANLTKNDIETDDENFGEFLFGNIFNNSIDSDTASANPLQSNDYIEFNVRDIPVSTTFVLLLYASNAKGRSNYVTLSAATMPPGSRGSEFLKFTADFGIKPMMYLLITVVIGLVISAIIIMIVSKIRTINRSKGRHRSLSSPTTLSLSKANKSMIKQISADHNDNNGQNISLDIFSAALQLSNKLDNHQNGNGDNTSNLHPVTLLDLNTTNSNIIHEPSQSPFNDHCLGPLLGNNNNSSSLNASHHYGTLPINPNHSLYKQIGHNCNNKSPKHCQPHPLNVIIKNPLMEHLSSSHSPSSIDSLPSQPPPMYHTVYASETTSADPFFSIHPCQTTRSDSNTNSPLHLLMDVSSYYQHNTDKISNQSALLPSNYHGQSNTIGSMTWSQAETLPLGGGPDSRNGVDSHIGHFMSPTSPISTLSVPFPLHQHSQLLGSTMIMEEQNNLCESNCNPVDDQPTTSTAV